MNSDPDLVSERERPFVPSIFNLQTMDIVKENRRRWAPLGPGWLWAAAAAAAAGLLLALALDERLPPPRDRATAAPDQFIADIAKEHLHNLTVIGPRVAGSYENEVLAVRVLVEAARRVRAEAAPHHRVDIDVQRASGAFPITFLDGLNNVYRGVQSVVVRVSAAGGGAGGGPGGGGGRQRALLLNCHFDTVPDSPGGSDDAAGCAVLLEVLRALTSRRAPLRHHAIFLFNGAEENIMQASHGFITQHKWAREVRAFINIEACGAGGREVLFQAGPRDPWLMEVYSAEVPYPFASSLAQEIFESGAVPGDTDFRIFRDFANLSGVDLAWSSNGYVYHTALDTAEGVPAGSLQRAGDNVLALALGLLSAPQMSAGAAGAAGADGIEEAGQGVFFDVVGGTGGVVCLRAGAALALAAALLAALSLRLWLTARDAKQQLRMSGCAWTAAVCGAGARGAVAAAGGMLGACACAALLHAARTRLAWYSTPALLAPLYGVPAVVWSWWCLVRLDSAERRGGGGGGGGGRLACAGADGAWRARAAAEAGAAGWGALLALAVALRLRSGYLPALWLAGSLLDLVPTLLHLRECQRWWWWAAGGSVPMLQTWSLAASSLAMFVPIAARAGDALAPDVVMAAATGAMALAACSWIAPLVLVTRSPGKLIRPVSVCCGAVLLLTACTRLGDPYSASRPQRLMLFHTRVTEHGAALASPADTTAAPSRVAYWVPALDTNTELFVKRFADDGLEELRGARGMSEGECARLVYCGAPYYLPARSLLPRALWLPAAPLAPPLVTIAPRVTLHAHPTDNRTATLHLAVQGPSHIVVIVSPAWGAALTRSSLLEAPAHSGLWRGRHTHFFLLHDATAQATTTGTGGADWTLTLTIQKSAVSPGPEPESSDGAQWASLSVAGHALSGALSRAAPHRALLRRLAARPLAPTGWGVDLHLYTL